jgi:hypothetical protein
LARFSKKLFHLLTGNFLCSIPASIKHTNNMIIIGSFLIILGGFGYLFASLIHAAKDEPLKGSGYTQQEETCPGCMGPCGQCTKIH